MNLLKISSLGSDFNIRVLLKERNELLQLKRCLKV